MNRRTLHRSQSAKCRASPSTSSIINDNCLNLKISSSLPEAFVSSLRQLFSILDKTNCGYVPFDVFKRYFDCSSSYFNFLNELEFESTSSNHLITFNLLINAIERSLLSTKNTSSNLIPKTKRSLNRSPSVLVISPAEEKAERQIPTSNRNSNGLEVNNFRALNPIYFTNRVKRNNDIDFSMIRSLKQFEIERDLLIETCNTLDRVKLYLTDCLYDMKRKQKSYCRYLTTAETIGVEPEPLYNRDLVADLFKLANIVVQEVDYNLKKLSDRSFNSIATSIYGSNSRYEKKLKAKDDYIKQLETEKRILLNELIQMKRQRGTIIPIKIS
ncbi:unnamed protein product [Rotaria socialis]|uniref:Suppressor APC domain-containing protein n=1 Tax=Rotaria socialis TaxID=392032 RepID=A0A818XCX7_9BILA|nr:unnamed protein product [Rotaria socialis]CAF3542727.1 unnamed protein product [Rotaria socialis]CAF3738697.1 unnamed protein product [Rotaria socialis]CAF4405296.1 unnamed protein product [Rotaria socialis]CAF4476194.1 unnamed protein product [Rotaria socialis]